MLSVSNPDNVGGLWNNSGTLAVSTKDVFFNSGQAEIDLSAGGEHIAGISNGYIEFTYANREQVIGSMFDEFYFQITGNSQSISMYDYAKSHEGTARASDITVLQITQSFVTVLRCEFTLPARGTFRLEFSPSGHAIFIDDVQVTPVYRLRENQLLDDDAGSSSFPIEIPPSIDTFVFSSGIKGNYYGFIVADGATPSVQYDGTDGASVFTESVYAAHGIFGHYEWSGAFTRELVGLQEYEYTKNLYKTSTGRLTDSIYADIDSTPADADRAYLKYKDTGLPIISDAGSDPYPDWSSIPISNIARNEACWYYKKAMTCFSVKSEFAPYSAHVTAISPRHGIIAEHVRDDFPSTWQDKKFWFMDLTGNYQEVKAIDYELAGDELTNGEATNDLCILLFDNQITVDIDYAAFMTDSSVTSYNHIDSYACGPSKEGIFSIETESQLAWSGLKYPITEQPEYQWSRYNNPNGDTGRIGDSSSPAFLYNGEDLILLYSTLFVGSYPYSSGLSFSFSTSSPIDLGFSNPNLKGSIKTAMDALDDRNGILTHYNLVEKVV